MNRINVSIITLVIVLWVIHIGLAQENINKGKTPYIPCGDIKNLELPDLTFTSAENGELIMTRPVYPYPRIAVYDGAGDPKVVIASKFGIMRNEKREFSGINGQPDYVHSACDASLKRLGLDYIDLYYQHRVDTNVPIEDTVGANRSLE